MIPSWKDDVFSHFLSSVETSVACCPLCPNLVFSSCYYIVPLCSLKLLLSLLKTFLPLCKVLVYLRCVLGLVCLWSIIGYTGPRFTGPCFIGPSFPGPITGLFTGPFILSVCVTCFVCCWILQPQR